ncbi:hypothetical protein BDZ94DRAFT_1192610 [Collybia nuda]|uniref:DH domain-containing protein n=1 Tax=Collybia nuda TaxID=64659 RepID=A0A9P6CK68_9AGAR|nr:hypothetical protein BDZ94DRAFT_1192610 [Collybia nuda]
MADVETAAEGGSVQGPSHEITSPRSRRVGIASPPPGFALSTSPPIPVRSPLRPVGRSLSNASTSTTTSTLAPTTTVTTARPQAFTRPATPPLLDIDDLASIVEDAIPLPFQMRHRSFLSLSGPDRHPTFKPLPSRPESPISVSLDDSHESGYQPPPPPPPPPMTKRQHALLELLSSERAYASDLALIREVHMPLALGQPVPLHPVPPSPPNSSASSSRTFSTASDSSSSTNGPPMTPEDARIIFNNIAELAIFSDRFCEAIELALGSLLEGGTGEDRVGALFADIIPELERPYKQYITRHPAALTHLGALPQTPALTAYLAHTQTVASSHSHAWDLASLLIKPVQRLLKYPLLLAAIIDETPDTHPDKINLQNARKSMEEVARNVNEGRRRAEVVKEVLTAKKKGVNVGVAASVNLTKMKSLRHGSKSQSVGDANGEAVQVERLHAELKRIDVFVQQLARNIVDWSKTMRNVIASLRIWAISFGKVIGISAAQGSEAFDAFMSVVADHLTPLCTTLEERINDRLLKEIAHLLATMNQPLKLLASMSEQEPYHYHLLTMNVSAKNRPPATLLEASTNYLALRGQLAAELPHYLTLLHRGLAVFIRKLAEIQAAFWQDTRDHWADLWEMLRVEGEMNAGHAETVGVWRMRWADVDEVMGALNINQAKKLYQDPPGYLESQMQMQGAPGKRSAPVVNMLAALEPIHGAVAPYAVSGPLPLARSTKTRARGSSDASVATTFTAKRSDTSTNASKKSGGRVSTDSLPVGKTPQKRRTEEFVDYMAPASPPASAAHPRTKTGIPRTKSMPLPSERTMSHRSSASSKTLVGGEGDSGSSSVRHSQELPEDSTDRGRTSRKPSLRRKFTESFRQRSLSKNNPTPSSPTSFFDDFEDIPSSPRFPPPIPQPPPPQTPTNAFTSTQRDSWVTKRAKYVCQVVHGCQPPAAVSYFSFPFFTLVEGHLYEVLQEAGHPSIHPKLPLYVDDGEDCLLLCRDEDGNVGWALASFLAPLGVTPD